MMRSLLQKQTTVKRAFRFLGRNLFRNPRYFFAYAARYLDPDYTVHPKVLSDDSLITSIESGASLIRLGDGEIYLMNYGSIHYQDYDPELRAGLFQLVREYTDTSPYRIGIPLQLSLSNQELRARALLHCWLPLKICFNLYFPKNVRYFDAHLFYRSGMFDKSLSMYLKDKHVVCAGNQKVLDDTLYKHLSKHAAHVSFVISSERNAYGQKEELISKIDLALSEVQGGMPPVILLAVGPASKIIAYEYAKRGIQALDIGHGIETVGRELDYSGRI